MVQDDGVNAKKRVVCERTLSVESDDLDVDLIISRMKEVGHRDSEGRLVLPKYYDE